MKKISRKNEDMFRLVLENNPYPMWIYDHKTLKFREVNRAATAKYGYTREEFLKMKITEIRPQDQVPRLLTEHKKFRMELRHIGEWQHLLKDGTLIDVEITAYLVFRWARRDPGAGSRHHGTETCAGGIAQACGGGRTVTGKLAALHFYQLAIPAPKAPQGSLTILYQHAVKSYSTAALSAAHAMSLPFLLSPAGTCIPPMKSVSMIFRQTVHRISAIAPLC